LFEEACFCLSVLLVRCLRLAWALKYERNTFNGMGDALFVSNVLSFTTCVIPLHAIHFARACSEISSWVQCTTFLFTGQGRGAQGSWFAHGQFKSLARILVLSFRRNQQLRPNAVDSFERVLFYGSRYCSWQPFCLSTIWAFQYERINLFGRSTRAKVWALGSLI